MAVHPIASPQADFVRVLGSRNYRTYSYHHVLAIKNDQV